MHLVQMKKATHGTRQAQGLAGWVLTLMDGRSLFARAPKRPARKHMRVVETLPIGPKRNLFLISCDGERFLVGGGADSVETIVRVRPEGASLVLARGGEQTL